MKYLAKTFTLPDVQPGGIIEYYYTYDYREYYIYDSHWIISDELFTKHAKFSLKPYSSTYQRFSVRWTWQDCLRGEPSPKRIPTTLSGSKSSMFHPSRQKTSCLRKTS